jgi:hypothetical protein
MKFRVILAGMAAAVLAVAACSPQNKETTTSDAAKESSNFNGAAFNYFQQTQPPEVPDYSQYRQTIIEAQRALASGISTWTHAQNYGVAKPGFSCPSIGPAVPENATVTPPEEALQLDSAYDGNSRPDTWIQGVPTIEPGLGAFLGDGTNGTYVICVLLLEDGRSINYLVRAETQVFQSSIPTKWDETQQMIVVDVDAVVKMLDGGAEFPVFTDCSNNPEKCKEGNSVAPSVNDTVATEDGG